MRQFAVLMLLLLGAACAPVATAPPPEPSAPVPVAQGRPGAVGPAEFRAIIRQMEPVIERECRARTTGLDCDYGIVVDDRPGIPANAFQTRTRTGQPVIGFTVPLIREMYNRDELAFVLGHEAAHHIEGHIDRGRSSATAGAVLAGALAAAGGADAAVIERAQQVGAFVGQRQFSRQFELEADALGAILTQRAGYDPVRGVAYFYRAPDPGNRFLGTHPPNAERISTVRRAVGR